MEGRIIVAIDVGTYKIVTVIAKVFESVISVLRVSEVKSQGIRKGQVVDIEEAVHAVNGSLEAAKTMAGYSASHVVVSLGGSQISCRNLVALSRLRHQMEKLPKRSSKGDRCGKSNFDSVNS